MVATIQRRETVDGCGCVRCRNIDPSLVRRSTAGDLRWSLRLFRRRPALLAVTAGLAFLYTVSKPALVLLTPSMPLGGALTTILRDAVSVLLLGVFLRGYVGAVVATEATSRTSDHRQLLAYTARRIGPLTLTVGGLFLILGAMLGVSIVLVSILVFDFGLLGPAIFDGITPTLLFGSVLAPVFYKFWLAPDVCVVGTEGPIAALRASWRITSVHWRRVCLLLVSFTATIVAPQLAAALFSSVGSQPLSSIPGGPVFTTLFQWLSAVTWYCVGTQIYIRSTLTTRNRADDP